MNDLDDMYAAICLHIHRLCLQRPDADTERWVAQKEKAEKLRAEIEHQRRQRRAGVTKPTKAPTVKESSTKPVMNETRVRALRQLSAEGVDKKDLAAYFGISQQTVWRITTRRTWQHVK